MIEPKTEMQRYWAEILQEAQTSGKSLADYARANNFAAQTLYQWRSVLKERETPPEQVGVRFSQVVTTPPNDCTLSIEINSTQLSFHRLPDVEWLSAFISAQSDTSC